MTSTEKLQKSYDHILVGYTPASLVVAQDLKARGESFCIIDSSHLSVEPLKFFPAIDSEVFTDLPFQAGDFDMDFMSTWRNHAQLDVGLETSVQGPPLSFVKGSFKSFLGFDKAKIVADEEYLRYCQESRHFQNEPEAVLKTLRDGLEPHIFLDQQVTSLEFEGKTLMQLGLNGNKSLKGSRFTFFNNLKWIVEELAHVETSISSRLKKVRWYSTIHLNFSHPLDQIPEDLEWNSPYLLMGSKEQPCLGSFRKITEDKAVSQWQSYIPAELTMDSETTGVAVKEIKKQVKRAFPKLFTQAPQEQIILQQNHCANLAGVQEKLSNFNNLNVCSPMTVGQRGWIFDLALGWGLTPREHSEPTAHEPEASL